MTPLRSIRQIAILLVLASWAVSAQAAATFDSKFEKGQNTGASPFSFVSNAGTVTGTVGANSNRVLIGSVAFERAGAVGADLGTVAMTWGGVSMTLIGAGVDTSTGSFAVYLFGLIAPATGAQTLSVSWTGTHSGMTELGAVSLYNADQSTGWQNAGSDTGTGTSASSTVTTASGNLVVVGHVNANATGTTINQGTSAWIDTAFTGNSAAGYTASVAGTAVVSWTLGSSVAWANSKVDVIAAAGGASTPNGLGLLGVGK